MRDVRSLLQRLKTWRNTPEGPSKNFELENLLVTMIAEIYDLQDAQGGHARRTNRSQPGKGRDIADALSAMIAARSMSDAELARAAGVPRSTLSRILSRRVSPSLKTIGLLSKALGYSSAEKFLAVVAEHAA